MQCSIFTDYPFFFTPGCICKSLFLSWLTAKILRGYGTVFWPGDVLGAQAAVVEMERIFGASSSNVAAVLRSLAVAHLSAGEAAEVPEHPRDQANPLYAVERCRVLWG